MQKSKTEMIYNKDLVEMNDNYSQNGRPRSLYYLATIVVVTKLILAYSEIIVVPDFVNSIFNYTYLFLMLLKIISTFSFKMKKVYLVLVLFGMMALYTSLQTDNYIILISAMGMIAMKGMPIRSIIRTSFKTKVFWLTIHFVCFAFAMAFFTQLTEYSIIDEEKRYRIFLSQPNTCAMLYLWAIFEYMYLNYERLNLKRFIRCTFLYGVIFLITKSKTSGIVYVLVWAIIWQKKSGMVKKAVYMISKYGYIGFSIFFSLITVIYTKLPFAQVLNTIFTGRLAGASKAYELYGFTVFGQYLNLGTPIDWDPFYGITSIWLENTYTMVFLYYGMIYAVLISIALWYVTDYLTDRDRIFVCAMLIYGISESYIVDVFLCFPLLLVAWAIYNKQEYLMMNGKRDNVL